MGNQVHAYKITHRADDDAAAVVAQPDWSWVLIFVAPQPRITGLQLLHIQINIWEN